MKRHMPVTELARDERFERMRIEDVVFDPRNAAQMADDKRPAGFRADNYEAPDAARALMHGIFVGEIQALEGAGRTCWDFPVGAQGDAVPFELKLDMARQCWDEARHVEISVKLTEHMGSETDPPNSRMVLNTSMARPSRARFTPASRRMASLLQAASNRRVCSANSPISEPMCSVSLTEIST